MITIIKMALIFSLFTLSVFAAKKTTINYSESVDVFEIVDHTSLWRDGLENAYSVYWKEKINPSGSDLKYFERYAEIRRKYQAKDRSTQETSLFSTPVVPIDLFSYAFYSSQSVGEAIGKLKKKLKKDEIDFLISFFEELKPRISKLVKESTLFRPKLKELNKSLKKKKGTTLIRKLKKFFEQKGRKTQKLKVFLVWWPASETPKITVNGKNVFLRYHPIEHMGKITMPDIMEGVVHSFISSMSHNDKVNLTKLFRRSCTIKGPLNLSDIIEKPLAVAIGKIYFEAEFKRKKFEFHKDWSLNPWVNTYAKLLYPLFKKSIKSREVFRGSRFMPKASMTCHELSVLKDFFSGS